MLLQRKAIIAGLISGAIYTGLVGVTSWFATRPSVQEELQKKDLGDSTSLIADVMEKAAGEDRVLSLREKSDLLRKLDMSVIIDENELLKLLRNKNGFVDVYASTNSNKVPPIGDMRYLGSTSFKKLEEYLGDKVEVEKNE